VVSTRLAGFAQTGRWVVLAVEWTRLRRRGTIARTAGEVPPQGLLALAVRVGRGLQGDGAVQAEVRGTRVVGDELDVDAGGGWHAARKDLRGIVCR
jgi:hypothetical protein